MLSRISLRLSDVLPRDARKPTIWLSTSGSAACAGATRETAMLQRTLKGARDQRGPAACAGASVLFSSRRPVRGGGAGVKGFSHRHPLGCALCCVEGSSHPLCKRGVWYDVLSHPRPYRRRVK